MGSSVDDENFLGVPVGGESAAPEQTGFTRPWPVL